MSKVAWNVTEDYPDHEVFEGLEPLEKFSLVISLGLEFIESTSKRGKNEIIEEAIKRSGL